MSTNKLDIALTLSLWAFKECHLQLGEHPMIVICFHA